jgi:Ca2+/Na+ antiporter
LIRSRIFAAFVIFCACLFRAGFRSYRRRVGVLLILVRLLLALLLILLLALLVALLVLLFVLLFCVLLLSGQTGCANEKQRSDECEAYHGDSYRLDSVCYHESCLRPIVKIQ